MSSRFIRVLLVIIGIAIGIVATYFIEDADTRITTHRSSIETLREQAAALTATIADVRAGQFAYVARGQGEAFWMSHVASTMPTLQKQTADFVSSLTSPSAQTAFEPAAAALENFRMLDSRVKEMVRSGNLLLAADLIFSDGVESTTTARAQVAVALTEELQARSGMLADLRGRQITVARAAAGGLLVVMIVLAVTAAGPSRAAEPEPVTVPTVEPLRFEAPLPKAKPAVTPKLICTAQLCSELARVVDPKQLSSLLARAAKVLDASGIILWVAEPSRQALVPAVSHGYEPKIVMRMGSIHRDANNAAAAAYRTSQTRTVSGDASTSGAMIVPLLTSEGCVGVMSAEMRSGSEKDESSQALASIFAAQLATLVATPAAVPMKAAAQA